MRSIYAYETYDGKIFTNEREAKEHQGNIIGQMLDDLLPNDDRGNVTRADRFNLLTKQLADKDLKKKITELYNALHFGDEE